MFNFTTKMMPVNFLILNNKEIEVDELALILNQFSDEDELKDYELIGNKIIADILVEEEILINYIGSRMANIYKKTNKFDKFYNDFLDAYDKFSDN